MDNGHLKEVFVDARNCIPLGAGNNFDEDTNPCIHFLIECSVAADVKKKNEGIAKTTRFTKTKTSRSSTLFPISVQKKARVLILFVMIVHKKLPCNL